MKWQRASHAVVILLLLFYAAQAAANQSVSDAEIERDIAWVLQTDSFLGEDVFRVEVRNGIVNLDGHVTTPWERDRAQDLVARVNGVVAVKNNLTYSIFRNPFPAL